MKAMRTPRRKRIDSKHPSEIYHAFLGQLRASGSSLSEGRSTGVSFRLISIHPKRHILLEYIPCCTNPVLVIPIPLIGSSFIIINNARESRVTLRFPSANVQLGRTNAKRYCSLLTNGPTSCPRTHTPAMSIRHSPTADYDHLQLGKHPVLHSHHRHLQPPDPFPRHHRIISTLGSSFRASNPTRRATSLDTFTSILNPKQEQGTLTARAQ